ncbi:MAG: adenosylcobinamide amidohydrolase [Methanoregulaceae archaeon]
MNYFFTTDTLFLRGSFTAASTGVNGGMGHVTTIFNHTVPSDWKTENPEREVEKIIAGAGFSCDAFGLFTSVPMRNLCVVQYDRVTVFVTAGIPLIPGTGTSVPHTINIIVYSAEGLSRGALLETIIEATEAKGEALRESGLTITGTVSDAVITCCEGPVVHAWAGAATPIGKNIRECVRKGVAEALLRNAGATVRGRHSFFILSRFGGNNHWVEWLPEGCPYYPCHKPGQRCDFCYCPFYPCKDEEVGQWVEGSQGTQVWNCSRCTLVHEPEIADYLLENPEASLEELKRRWNCRAEREKRVIP